MYARLAHRGVELESYPASRPSALLFVDLNIGIRSRFTSALGFIRSLSPLGLAQIRRLLIRWPDSLAGSEYDKEATVEYLHSLLKDLNLTVSLGLIHAQLSKEPQVEWSTGSFGPADDGVDDQDVLLICREVELTTLLIRGRAVWRPDHYHYRLPNSRHSGMFVRLADAIRSVRDAQVLAWWLRQHVSGNLGVVMDTATVISIVLALSADMEAHGLKLGMVETLADYPATVSEFTRSIRDVSTRNADVLALLSVSSSGSMRDKLVSALSHMLDDRWFLHTFVDKTGSESFHKDVERGALFGRTSVWAPLGVATDLSSIDSLPGETVDQLCRICKDPDRAGLVQIDPNSFDGLVLPEPELVTPDVRVAGLASQFWRLCDESGAIAFDVNPHQSTAGLRPHRYTMGVRIDFDLLLLRAFPASDNGVRTDPRGLIWLVVDRLKMDLAQRPDPSLKKTELIVGLANEFARADGRCKRFFQEVFGEVPPGVPMVSLDIHRDRVEDGDSELLAKICNVKTVCIATLGVVTGASLHAALTRIQGIRRDEGLSRADVGVLAVHLRPSSERDQQTIINPFGKEMFIAVYKSFLPYGPSPLQEEESYLSRLRQDPALEEVDYYSRRLLFLSSSDRRSGSSMGLFWGTKVGSNAQLRPGSLYGESLSAMGTLAAVGSAVHSKRYFHSASGGAPERRQFEIPAIMRSYYDPLIVCSVLRWLQPEECWWGRGASSAAQVIRELCLSHRDSDEEPLILAELLLAAAMGKVPKGAVGTVVDQAEEYLARRQGGDRDEDDIAALKLGLQLIDREFRTLRDRN